METIDDIIKYVQHTPENTNPAVLKSMLQNYGSGSGLPEGGTPYQYLVTDGDGNAKWEDRLAYETKPVLTEIAPEETITFTPNSGMMSALWPPTFNAVEGSTYIVKFDGTEYKCSCIRLGGEGGLFFLVICH